MPEQVGLDSHFLPAVAGPGLCETFLSVDMCARCFIMSIVTAQLHAPSLWPPFAHQFWLRGKEVKLPAFFLPETLACELFRQLSDQQYF